MTLHFVDSASAVTDALRRHLGGVDGISIETGDILAVAHTAIVSPANSLGYMDGGIDRIYVEYFGVSLQGRVLDAIACLPDARLPIGGCLVIPTGDPRVPHLLVAPTVDIPGPTTPAAVFHALSAVLRVGTARALPDVFCPGLGTGVGMLEPEEAAQEMAAAYRKWRETIRPSGAATPGVEDS